MSDTEQPWWDLTTDPSMAWLTCPNCKRRTSGGLIKPCPEHALPCLIGIHPEVPRVEFDDDGVSMNIEQAVERFRHLLRDGSNTVAEIDGSFEFTVGVKMRPCDCDSDIRGRDESCPLHGNPHLLRSEDMNGLPYRVKKEEK